MSDAVTTDAAVDPSADVDEEALEQADSAAFQEAQATQLAAAATRVTTVSAVRDVAVGMREVTFRGGDLATFRPLGADTFLYLLLPPPGRPELAPDSSFTWEKAFALPEEERPVGAYYTVRRWRPEVAEMDIWMVLHGDEGPASAWAGRAAVGDQVALWGPRSAYEPPAGTDRLLLVADETGLPAVAALLAQRPAGMPVRVIAEVDDEAHRPPLPVDDNVTVTWVHRDGAAPGTTTLLLDAVVALPPFEGQPYVWGGAESRTLTKVRKEVRVNRGLPREQVSLVGYWRR